jgi:hypothetical protein
MQQLVAQANPNPPGRPAGPGQAMPVYQGVPNAPWDGAARGVPNAPTPKTVTAHPGLPSNSKVGYSSVNVLVSQIVLGHVPARGQAVAWRRA